MLYIMKKPCPSSIQAEIDLLIDNEKWKALPEEPSKEDAEIIRRDYFNHMDKERVRESLLEEQHGLCAYCMRRIENDDQTTIEHVYPLSKSKQKAMDYVNWVAVCDGGQHKKLEEGEERVCCCDVKKGNNIPKLSPLNQVQMKSIAYYDDGTMFYNGSSKRQKNIIQHEINYTYGLNGKVDLKTGRSRLDTSTGIVKGRKDSFDTMFEVLQELWEAESLTSELIINQMDVLTSATDWEEFVGVKLYVLKDFLHGMQATT